MKTITFSTVRVSWEGFDEAEAGTIRLETPVTLAALEEGFVEEVRNRTTGDEDGLYVPHGGGPVLPATSYHALHAVVTLFILRNQFLIRGAEVSYDVPPPLPSPEPPLLERDDLIF